MATQSIQSLPQAAEVAPFNSDEVSEVIQRAHTFTNAAACILVLLEEEQLVIHTTSGNAPQPGTRMPVGDSFAGRAVLGGKLLRCNDANADATVDVRPFLPLRVRSLVVAPLSVSRTAKGALLLVSESPSAFSNTHIAIVRTLADVAGEKLAHGTPAPQSTVSPSRAAFAAALTSAPLRPASPVTPVAASTLTMRPAQAADATATAAPLRSVTSIAAPVPSRASASQSAGAPVTAPMMYVLKPVEEPEVLPSAAAIEPAPKPRKIESIAPRPVAFRTAPPSAQPFNWELNQRRSRAVPIAIGVTAAVLLSAVGVSAWMYSGAMHDPGPPTAIRTAPPVVAGALPAVPPPVAAPVSASLTVPASQPPVAEVKPVEAQRTASAAPAKSKESVAPPNQPEAMEMALPAPIKHNEVAPVVEAPGLNTVVASNKLPELPGSVARPAPPVTKAAAAELLQRVEPEYPPLARRMQMQGEVAMRVHVARDGSVDDVTVTHGEAVFRNSAIAAVKQWRYKPASLNGSPVDSEAQVVLRFSLPKN